MTEPSIIETLRDNWHDPGFRRGFLTAVALGLLRFVGGLLVAFLAVATLIFIT